MASLRTFTSWMMSETVIVVHFIFKMSDFALLIKNSLLGLVLHNVTLECSLCSCNIFESASRKVLHTYITISSRSEA